MQFHFHANQSHFNNNGFALRRTLKLACVAIMGGKGPKGARKGRRGGEKERPARTLLFSSFFSSTRRT